MSKVCTLNFTSDIVYFDTGIMILCYSNVFQNATTNQVIYKLPRIHKCDSCRRVSDIATQNVFIFSYVIWISLFAIPNYVIYFTYDQNKLNGSW